MHEVGKRHCQLDNSFSKAQMQEGERHRHGGLGWGEVWDIRQECQGNQQVLSSLHSYLPQMKPDIIKSPTILLMGLLIEGRVSFV